MDDPRPDEPAAAPVDAVVVAYDSATTIEACHAALRRQPEVGRIIVVDNGSRDDTCARLRAIAFRDPRLVVLERPGNPGFAAGCNAGAEASGAPWLLFANPDVELPPGALAALLAHARSAAATPEGPGNRRPLGVLGADLRDAAGRRDGAARRRDLSWRAMLAAAGRRGALDVDIDERRALQPVDACSGALMLVPRAAFDAVGGWDAGYRLHVEDLDFCRRLRDAGFAVAVANDVPVLHHRGVSSRARPLFVEWHKHRGLWRYWRRFEGRGIALLAAPLVAAVLGARLLAVVARGLVRRDGAHRR